MLLCGRSLRALVFSPTLLPNAVLNLQHVRDECQIRRRGTATGLTRLGAGARAPARGLPELVVKGRARLPSPRNERARPVRPPPGPPVRGRSNPGLSVPALSNLGLSSLGLSSVGRSDLDLSNLGRSDLGAQAWGRHRKGGRAEPARLNGGRLEAWAAGATCPGLARFNCIDSQSGRPFGGKIIRLSRRLAAGKYRSVIGWARPGSGFVPNGLVGGRTVRGWAGSARFRGEAAARAG